MYCHKLARWLTLGLALTCYAATVSAAVRLPAIIGNNMVLQRGQPVPIWGWADPNETVTVTLAGQNATAKADGDGRWKVVLQKLELREPQEMTIQGTSGSTMTLKNILVGDVWVCSGQSNMERGIGEFKDAKKEIASAEYPNIRLFMVARAKMAEPATDVKGAWAVCSPQSVAANGRHGFSATGYYFGRDLHRELHTPIGLIQTAWGGTPAKFWTSREALTANPEFKSLTTQPDSSSLFNGMIAPLIPFAIRGVVWYQGENDVHSPKPYRTLFPALIADWRQHWGQGDFPFGFVQLAPYRYKEADPANWAELCEAQRMTLDSTPNTGMAVTVDIGDIKDVHPKNKQDVGRRLALWALAKVYGRDIVYSGPLYKSMHIEGDKIRLEFDHIGGGLTASDNKPLSEFTIAGSDRRFVPAVAEINGNSILVRGEGLTQPVTVRFAWRDETQPNLSNREGLPASPFRTDTWDTKRD